MRVLVLMAALASASAFSVAPMGLTTPAKAALSFKSARSARAGAAVAPKMMESGFVPDMGRRNLMNALLLGSIAGPILVLPAVLISFLTPAKAGGGGGGTVAKDALGNEVKIADWLAAHPAGDRKLVQGLKGDATYLITKEDGKLESFGVNAVCTHLGCVVPWNKASNKFMCPCHGSQYDKNGMVVRGPAPLSLALAKLADQDGLAVFTAWTEKDFRTGLAPWWKA
ncbi:Rieske [2Fe-2S] iron-sulfur domain-containing protein [Baffinella frigidus]|nr:Rieske [2Fe-2S] iron-sulfur domain-containing protein [Cryptophyta sp. CCMP2293]|mmetsp:Transcript_3525/g.8847  ORF Transcript_3525/g.8847 Transcript_3525/m.8847 type:complete len:226 (-) Transcript_3525:84-761(-)